MILLNKPLGGVSNLLLTVPAGLPSFRGLPRGRRRVLSLASASAWIRGSSDRMATGAGGFAWASWAGAGGEIGLTSMGYRAAAQAPAA